MKHITIKDIAKHLTISVSTVSRALVDDKNIRRETKEKVLEAAKKLGYKPNPVATNLKYGRTNTVGVIVPEMVTPSASLVIEAIQRVLYPKGLKVIIAQSNENSETERENLLTMERFMVDGIIICLCHHSKNKEEYMRLQKEGIPMVFYDRIPDAPDASKIVVNDYTKSFFLVEHLIRSGRKRIAHLQAPDYILNSHERYRGYRNCLEKFNIPYDDNLVIKTGMTIANGRQAAERLLKNKIPFDAIFAFTETLAIGAMNYLREQSVKIPNDVAIAGFSGTELSTIVYPQLTTVEQPFEKMGQTAAELILEKIKNPETSNRTVVLDAEMKLRQSTECRI
ncbi:MAG: Catabolite control protein A [Candidatus Ordinivivax streblomastigis]|uniref:Catabolite control protein A n=1 Tax=Candidatus Ordinivivax streblomastigis TaxID=2540710 RepID=A0A5M8NV81_9BACT|nr:MAG: Catabolite control protein A [Candidatus Ordinivivax streblomastigis]